MNIITHSLMCIHDQKLSHSWDLCAHNAHSFTMQANSDTRRTCPGIHLHTNNKAHSEAHKFSHIYTYIHWHIYVPFHKYSHILIRLQKNINMLTCVFMLTNTFIQTSTHIIHCSKNLLSMDFVLPMNRLKCTLTLSHFCSHAKMFQTKISK